MVFLVVVTGFLVVVVVLLVVFVVVTGLLVVVVVLLVVLVVAAYKEKNIFKTFTTKELPDAATITISRTRKVANFIMNFDIKGKYK